MTMETNTFVAWDGMVIPIPRGYKYLAFDSGVDPAPCKMRPYVFKKMPLRGNFSWIAASLADNPRPLLPEGVYVLPPEPGLWYTQVYELKDPTVRRGRPSAHRKHFGT